MKKIMVSLILGIMLCGYGVYAGSAEPEIRICANPATGEVKLYGINCSEKNGTAVISIVYPGYDISDENALLEQGINRMIPVSANRYGAFDASYMLQNDVPYGEYTLIFNDGCGIEPHICTFLLPEQEDIQKSLSLFSTDISEASAKEFGKIFGINLAGDYAELSENEKDRLWEYVAQIKSMSGEFKSNTEVFDAFYKSLITVKLNSASNIIEVIEKNYSGLDFECGNYYSVLTDYYKEQAAQIIKDKLKTATPLNIDGIIEEGVKVAYFNKANRGNIAETVSILANDIGIDISDSSDFARISNPTDIYIVLAGKDDFTSYISIKSFFDAQVKAALGNSGGSMSGSSGGGKASGGGSSGLLGDVSMVNSNLNTTVSARNAFSDISGVEWAIKAIERLAAKGIISGTGDGRFMPDRTVKREEFVKMLVNALGLYESADISFTDVSDGDWFAEYVGIAYKAGIAVGNGDGSFGAGQEITRQDMCVMLMRAADIAGISLSEDVGQKKEFRDSDKISDYAKEAVDVLTASGIVNGLDDNMFAPKAAATRAMAAVMTDRMLEY